MDDPPQKTLTSEDRRSNMQTSTITLMGDRIPDGSPKDVVLLDDILTTGSTADRCACQLLSAGFKRVHVLTVALD